MMLLVVCTLMLLLFTPGNTLVRFLLLVCTLMLILVCVCLGITLMLLLMLLLVCRGSRHHGLQSRHATL